jgi:hypothetical protein
MHKKVNKEVRMEKESFHLDAKLKTAFLLAGLILFITGSFISIDWMNTFTGSQSFYPAYAKPAVSILCALIVFLSWGRKLDRKDYWLLASAFLCIVIVDITMSIYVYSANKALGSAVFFVGAALSIVAHILLIIRHAKGFHFLRGGDGFFKKYGFALAFYLPVIVIFLALIPFLNKVGQFWPPLIYAIILTTSLWVAWEAFRHRLFPRTNAWLIALGVTFWFVCELVGVVHNIEIGFLSTLAMNLTWHFYMPAILLLAFSGFKFGEETA